MVDNNNIRQANCPYWSAKSMKCRICSGGLFIPLDDHIEVYCKTPAFPQCLQFSLHTENHVQILDRREEAYKNRRKYLRIETEYKVTLVKLVDSGKIASHHSTIGKTLDVSMGGMRLATKTPLANDTLLQFSFDPSFPEELQYGSGQVAWCNKQIDEPGYQAGITFHDDHLIEAMGLYLGAHFGTM